MILRKKLHKNRWQFYGTFTYLSLTFYLHCLHFREVTHCSFSWMGEGLSHSVIVLWLDLHSLRMERSATIACVNNKSNTLFGNMPLFQTKQQILKHSHNFLKLSMINLKIIINVSFNVTTSVLSVVDGLFKTF